jgi:hypothetical protein
MITGAFIKKEKVGESKLRLNNFAKEPAAYSINRFSGGKLTSLYFS